MNYIKVWCEYDISGSFGGNNNEDVFAVSDSLSSEDIDQILVDRFADLAEDTECEGSLLDEGLMGWEYIVIIELTKE